MKKLTISIVLALLLLTPRASAEVWTNATGNNNFADWSNWVVDNTATIPTSWNATTQSWVINLAGVDRAVIAPGEVVIGVNRNVYVSDVDALAAGSFGEFLIDGGRLDITRNMRIGRGIAEGSGHVTLTNGGVLNLGYGMYIGQDANLGSSFNLVDGTVNITTNSSRTDGLLVGHRADGYGTLNISGGAMNVLRGDASFGDNGNAGDSRSALNLSGSGLLDVVTGRITFGSNAGAVQVAVSIADTALLRANNARFAFGDGNEVSLVMTGGTMDVAAGFITFGQSADVLVDINMSGGTILADRMIWANNATASARLDMSGGSIILARSGSSTTTITGGMRLQSGDSLLDVNGDALIRTEKLWTADGGVLRISGQAMVQVTGSSDGLNPTFDITTAYLADDWSSVLGKIEFNGGTFEVSGASEVIPVADSSEPPVVSDVEVNYAALLNAAIAAGAIHTTQSGMLVEAQYDPVSDVTALVLAEDPDARIKVVEFSIREAGGFRYLAINGPDGVALTIESSADLQTWDIVETINLTGSTISWYDPDPDSPFAPRRFYRGQIGR